MNRRNKGIIVSTYSVIHFLVDLACVFLVTSFVIPSIASKNQWLWCMLAYNYCAFAMQMPIGAIIDRINKPWLFASAGCILIMISYLGFVLDRFGFFIYGSGSTPGTLLMACIVAGIGNSCFHAGGGVSILGISQRNASLSGIFVSTGAFGVYLAPKLATAFAMKFRWCPFIAIFIMAVSAIVLYIGNKKFRVNHNKNNKSFIHQATEIHISGLEEKLSNKCEERNSNIDGEINTRRFGESDINSESKTFAIAILVLISTICLFITVCIRSYLGTVMSFSWKAVPILGFLFTVGIVLGKMTGGILGDRFGWEKISVGSLVISAAFFCVAATLPVAGIIGVFLFNMTMPITLTALANIFDNNHGFAFGMTTMALFLGTLPSIILQNIDVVAIWWMIPAVLIISAVILVVGFVCYNKIERTGDKK